MQDAAVAPGASVRPAVDHAAGEARRSAGRGRHPYWHVVAYLQSVQRCADEAWGEIGDDELTALALAADPKTAVTDDAVPLLGPAAAGLLPDWYMPAPAGGGPLLQGWRRRVGQLIVASFLLINGYGLCSTYGWVGFG